MVSAVGTTSADTSGNTYRVVLSDDFSNGYQTSKWGPAFGGGTYWNGAFSWSSADVGVRNGELQVTDTRHADGSWTAGGFSSFKAGNTITYGTVEFEARVEQAQGTQAAILMWPASDAWPRDGEIDILETPKTVPMHSSHWEGSDGSHQYDSIFSDYDPGQTHHYKMTWLPSVLTIEVDGKVVASWTDPAAIPDTAMGFGAMGYVAASGEAWLGGGPDGSTPNVVTTHIDNVVMSQWVSGSGNYTGGGGTGAKPPVVNEPTPKPADPVAKTIGSGSDTLVLKISQDAWQGNATYTISVDGKQVGGTLTAGASHAAGLNDVITVKGNWGAGAHKVTVNFTNDAYGGSSATDRNLHVDGITFNGVALASGSADLNSNGPVDFAFSKAAAVVTPPPVVDPPVTTTPGTATPPAQFGGRNADVWIGQADFGGSDYITYGGKSDWGTGPGAKLTPGSWDASWSSKLAFDNFVSTTIDATKAGSLDFDLMLVSAKRGAVTLGAGDDQVTWVAHSNSGGAALNTMVIKTGAGNDTVTITDAGRSSLADYDRHDNGKMYKANYDGQHSIADVTFGSGQDSVTVEGKTKLVLHAGSGHATATGGAGNDIFHAGTGTAEFTGGAGKDSFVFVRGSGHAVIEDFTSGTDLLQFSGGLTKSGVTTKAATEGGVSGLLVTYDTAGDSVFLAHVTKIAAADMLFA
jgi:hypothetical protein